MNSKKRNGEYLPGDGESSEAVRKIPHSPEAEQGVLGCILLSPNECLGQCIEKLIGGADTFYDLRHQTIYANLVAMYDDRTPIDIITLQQRLKDWAMLDEIGGIPYLNTLQDSVPSAANLSYYLDIISEKFLLRKTINTCTDIVGRVYEYTGEVAQLIDEVERDVLSIRNVIQIDRGIADIRALQTELETDYENALARRAPMGILTGYPELDATCGGMMGQEMIVIGGIPSSGKTTLALNIAARVARGGIKVSINSGETSAKKIVHRIISMMGQVEGGKFLRGSVEREDFEKMASGMAQVRRISENLLIHDSGALAESRLMANVRRDYQAGARLFVIDYLQLMMTKGITETERATNASKTVKMMASELNSPVIVISSLSRQEMGKPRKPTMRDLRQSGQIEFDADKIILLHCEDPTQQMREVEVNIVKNKDGPLGQAKFIMFAGQFRMEQAARVSDSDVPENTQRQLV